MQASLETLPHCANNWHLSNRAQLSHIMLIADDIQLAEARQLELTQQGYQVSVIHDGLRGLFAVRQVVPDLLIISWSPPQLSGIEICHRLRSSNCHMYKILLTQENLTNERNTEQLILGLHAGANDCLSPPFSNTELLARIQANLPFTPPTQENTSILQFADLQLNRRTREVFRGDRFIHLTAKEFDLLEYMIDNSFQVVTRVQILEDVWGYEHMGSSNIVEVYVRYLRKKIRNRPRQLFNSYCS